MRRTVLLVCAVLLFGAVAASPAPLKIEQVTYQSGGETVTGFLVRPEAAGRQPAIIVIHEWWGLNDWTQEQARMFAEHGYIALAVDLYRGRVATSRDEAHELSRGMPQDRAVRDLKGAFEYLASRSDVNQDRIGSVGWCMGGGLSLQLAVHEPRLAACVVYYGAMPTDSADIQKIRAAVLGNFGADDRGIPVEGVRGFDKAMAAANKQVDIKIYDGAGHAFQNPDNKAGYHPEAAKDARERTLAFFNRTLK